MQVKSSQTSWKPGIIKFVRAIGGVTTIVAFNRFIRRVSALTHYAQFVLQWGTRPVPGSFDHYLDIHYLWGKTRTPLSCERGILGLLAIKEGARVLELCCGDGFNTFHFYSIRAGQIVAIDFDADAIRAAGRNFASSNIEFVVGDIRKDMPAGQFDNIVWDASLEYFSEEEIVSLMAAVKGRLGPRGILSGQAMLQSSRALEHKYIFSSPQELARFLKPHFQSVRLIETRYPSRQSVYFYASDTDLQCLLQTMVAQN
jgi:SAM-dependent methyltransferase